MTRNKSTSSTEDKCGKCKLNFKKNDKLIHCNGCNIWWHSSFAEIEQEDLPTLHKYNAVHWYCKSCEALLKGTSLVELLTSLTSRLNDIQDEKLEDQMRLDTLQTNIDELKISVEKLHSKKTYAETVSPADSRPSLQTKTTDKQPGHDLNKTMVVTNTSNFSNSVAIKKDFAIETTHLRLYHS